VSKLRLTASEKEVIRPFVIDDTLLESCAILYSKKIGFDPSSSILLDDVEVDTLKVKFDLPLDDICSVFSIDINDLSISVIVRDQAARTYKVICEMILGEASETDELLGELPPNLLIGKLSISVVLTRKVDGSNFDTFNKLAQKEFKFSGANQKIDFPRVWKTAKEFAEAGLSKSALWHLSWIGEDLDKPLSELVVLWLNADYKTQLQVIGVSAQETAFQRLWASSILADLSRSVLTRGVMEDATSSLAFETIDEQFRGLFYSDHDQLRTLIQKPEFGSMVGAWTQDLVSLAEVVEKKRG
jgi:hypothetical protein